MKSPPILDIEALVRPIEGDLPAGEDLRNDPSPSSPYYAIKDARASARSAERSGMQIEEGRPALAPEWRQVLQLGPEILSTRAKDLEIAAWLTEALVREHGFAGLRDGLHLTRRLVETFWDQIYPEPDEDGISTRVAPLAGLNGGESDGTLSVPMRLAAITESGDAGVFGMWRYAKARELSREDNPQKIQDAIAAGAGTMEQFEAAVRLTTPEFFRQLVGDLEEALEHFQAMTAFLDEKCGHDSPPSSNIRNALTELRQTVAHVMQDVAGVPLDTGSDDDAAAAPDGASDAGDTASEAAAPAPAGAAAAPGEIRSRDDAFRLLSRAAEYFRTTEPHSPLSSLLAQAVRWGRMPLDQLIEELIPDSEARDHFGLLTGIRSVRGESEED